MANPQNGKLAESIFFKTGWFILTSAAVFLFATTLLYFWFYNDPTYNFLGAKPEVAQDPFWKTSFWIHITGGAIALITGPIQFVGAFRNRFLKFHRNLGKAYLVGILIIGGPAGLFMAFYANGGFWGSLGFCILSLLWMVTTFKAYEEIRKKNLKAHKDWMTRSFALTFSAVTLRTWVPLLSVGFGVEHDIVIVSTAWLSWIPNIIIAELIIRLFPSRL